MMDYEQNVGNYLISIDLGIGEIVSVNEISDNGYFYNVSFPGSKITNYFAVESPKFRLVSDKKAIKKAIDTYNSIEDARDFANSRDKIEYYRDELKAADICELAQALGELKHEEEIHTGIKKLYDMALTSFIDEMKLVLDVTKDEATGYLTAA